MGYRLAARGLPLRALDINMNLLAIAGCLRESVDGFLRDRHPFAWFERRSSQIDQLPGGTKNGKRYIQPLF
ncbi:hypothetical protein [Martelella soudanensis]|uniref:hypothetical protein n=1 Tax=unclassified Martelella TaxID=2629616 RepID=UPI001AEE50DC|nr:MULTISPECIES: hypothetical protein [unclassified Martelella]